jgi:hypothetical protein
MGDAENQRQPIAQKILEQLLKFREELIQETNGQLFEDSAKLIRNERIKRTKHLMEAATGKPFKLDDEDLADFNEDDLKDLAEDEM